MVHLRSDERLRTVADCFSRIAKPLGTHDLQTGKHPRKLWIRSKLPPQKNTPDVQLDHPGYEINFRRRPTLPLSFPSSTIGAKELNFRVRDGNGCDLFAIATEKLKALKSQVQFVCKRRLKRSDCVNYFVAKPHDRLVPVS